MRTMLCVLWMLVLASPADSTQAQEVKPADDGQELWYGVLEAGSRKLRFAVEIEQKDNTWAGELRSLDEGDTKFTLSGLEHSESTFAFDIKASSGRFEGKPDAAGTTIDGHWLQRKAKIPLVFKQVTELPQRKLKTLWVGELNAVFQKLEVVFREFENGDIIFDSVTQRAGGFVAAKTITGDNVKFDVPGVNGNFDGKFNEDKSRIEGLWSQGIVPLTLVLNKSEVDRAPAAAPKRPQTPKPPFPYDLEEVTISNKAAEGVQLAGTLTLPIGKQRTPVVVLISGSGPQDRDESILEHKPFWVIADHLSRQGIAVLRFDDRGVGKSTGTFETETSVDFASDVTAIVDFLSKHDRIDATQIGLCGHSEGGIIAPMVAAQNSAIAFVVMLAGTGVNGDQILASQSKLILEAAGTTKEETDRQSKMQRIFLDLAQITPALTQEEFVSQAMTQLEPLLSDEERKSGELKKMVEPAAQQLQSPWFRFFMTYEPAKTLERVRCPVLAMFGSRDLQVDPPLNIPPIKAALAAAGNEDFEVVVLPDLNHLFQKCKTGNIDEYQTLEETFNRDALDVLSNWIGERVH